MNGNTLTGNVLDSLLLLAFSALLARILVLLSQFREHFRAHFLNDACQNIVAGGQ